MVIHLPVAALALGTFIHFGILIIRTPPLSLRNIPPMAVLALGTFIHFGSLIIQTPRLGNLRSKLNRTG